MAKGARISKALLKQLQAAGRVQDATGKAPAKRNGSKQKQALPRPTPEAILGMHEVLQRLGIEYRTEHHFHPVRKWRFDIAVESLMLAVEYEGIGSEVSRHTTSKGYTQDSDKYNAAQALGWKVYRYTWRNWRQFEEDLLNILKDE